MRKRAAVNKCGYTLARLRTWQQPSAITTSVIHWTSNVADAVPPPKPPPTAIEPQADAADALGKRDSSPVARRRQIVCSSSTQRRSLHFRWRATGTSTLLLLRLLHQTLPEAYVTPHGQK